MRVGGAEMRAADDPGIRARMTEIQMAEGRACAEVRGADEASVPSKAVADQESSPSTRQSYFDWWRDQFFLDDGGAP